MKKIIALLFVLSIIALTSCKNNEKTEETNVDTKPTITDTNPATTVDTRYSVTVLYPDGKPVTSDTNVQWCHEFCLLPVAVDANGVAYKELDDAVAMHFVHLESMPAGYTYNPNIYTTNASNKHIVINLIALSNPTSGEGTAVNPYVITAGAYNVNLSKKGTVIYYSFTPTEAGTYVFESMAVDKLATNEIDPVIANMEDVNTLYDDGGVGENFKYSFAVEANQTYTFAITVNDAQMYPAVFDFILSKAE